MTKMNRLLFAATFFLLGLAGSRASADSCSADTDCPQSFACVVVGTSTAPACKGTGCPADGAAPDPVVYKACEPKACASDADCGTGMVCYEQKTTSCSGSGGSTSGCAANTKCDAGPIITMTAETCTTTTRNVCAFKWQLPCNADSDCGDAFVCQPSVSGGCSTSSRGVSSTSGGTGGGASSGSSSSPPAVDAGAPECQTTTSFPGACRAQATTCTGDSECPSGWTCTAIGTPVPVTGVGAPVSVRGDASAATPADSADAGGSTTKICIGPFGAGEPTRGGVDVGNGGETTTGSGHQGTGGSIPPASAGGDATGGTTGGASASPGSSGGGCAVVPIRARGSALLMLGLATVGLVLVRRRSRT